MSQVFVADEIATPTPSGEVRRYRPGQLEVSRGQIGSVQKISKAKLSSLSKKVKRARTIIPGLVDSHTHLVFGGQRAEEWNRRLKGEPYQRIYEEGGGIRRTVRETGAASKAKLLQAAKKRAKRALKNGITTIEAKSGYGLDLVNEMKILRVTQKLKAFTPQEIVPTFMGAHALRQDYGSTKEYIDYLIAEVIPSLGSLAEFQDVFCERGYFSKAESIRLLKAGRKYGLMPKVHAHEFGRTGGVAAACEVRATSADHLQYVNSADMRAMKKVGVIPVVLPGTSLFLGGEAFAPASKMWKAGLKVAIASDFNPGTNPSQNLLLAGTLGAIHEGLDLDQVLTAVTYHGALALRRRDRGLLARGKRADFLSLDVSRFEEIFYHYGDSFIKNVFIKGKRVA